MHNTHTHAHTKVHKTGTNSQEDDWIGGTYSPIHVFHIRDYEMSFKSGAHANTMFSLPWLVGLQLGAKFTELGTNPEGL